MSQNLPSVHEDDEEEHTSTQQRQPEETTTTTGSERNRVSFSRLTYSLSPGARLRHTSSSAHSTSQSGDSSYGSRGNFRNLSSLSEILPSFRRGDSQSKQREDSAGEIAAAAGDAALSRPLNRAISTAAARLGRKTSSSEIDASPIISREETRVYRRYRVGDPVLVSNHSSRFANLVNRYGYPAGEGITPEEQRGPYLYLLATVTKVHFEEDAEYYTVTRADTGVTQRADDEWMEPLRTARGEAAARRAATQYANVDSDDHDHDTDSKGPRGPLYAIMGPFIWLWDWFYSVVIRRICQCSRKALQCVRRTANRFLNGQRPFSFSAQFTMVNFLVLCSTWIVFMDQARLAFFPPSADFPLAVVDFAVWIVLVLELACELFIRPDGYQFLIISDKAYAPSTARYINRFHLFGEIVSLLTFVPEFLCLFSRFECGDRAPFSLFNALFTAILGPTRWDVFYGRSFIALIRLRVFGLVRHWKKMWIHNTFVTMRATGLKALVAPFKGTPPVKNVDPMEEEDKDTSLTNASNIGTALMVINSHRALVILWAITGFFPLVAVLLKNGGANLLSTNMVKQLQAINLIVTDVNDTDGCQFLSESLFSWSAAVSSSGDHNDNDQSPYLLYLWIEPWRCPRPAYSENDELITSVFCSIIRNETSEEEWSELEGVEEICTTWGDADRNITNDELASRAGIRLGSIQSLSESTIANLTLADGVTVNETEYASVAKFDQTIPVRTSAYSSFILQLLLLFLVLGGLSVLRRDAIVLVLGPLRRMLKIVARYAKNPLAPAATSQKGDHDSDDESGTARVKKEDELGNFETTQLINAITKIADLLRKCWGVAGADIISTNLATEEGALTGVFNPTVEGKSVFALFGFASIDGFSHAVHNLGGDVMILINDVAAVLHGEVFRWGFGDSGQCNKNLGNAFLMVYRIGLVKEVIKKLEQATDVVFAGSAQQKGSIRRRKKQRSGGSAGSRRSQLDRTAKTNAMSLNLQSLPGISTFTDRAVIGMLKSYAGIYRDEKLLAWRDDFRLGAGVGAFSVNMFFGLDAGWAVEGAVGSEYKIDATYLSPHVNMAARMMSACKQYGVSILLSQAVQELMSSTARSKLRHVDTVTVKGSSHVQKIFTYDARHKGVDFFLFSRSDAQADLDSERYSPRIWDQDQDLKAMRQHVTDDFLEEFNKGRDSYLQGNWPRGIRHLEIADAIMVESVMDQGFIEEELSELQNRILDGEERAEEELRSATGDGPSRCLINYMKSMGGKAPKDWKGYRPLQQK